jgi:hypothetical protein
MEGGVAEDGRRSWLDQEGQRGGAVAPPAASGGRRRFGRWRRPGSEEVRFETEEENNHSYCYCWATPWYS